MVDLDSNPTKLIEIVEVGKQLLITRGALTTFSIANDVAKYFAILPAIFAATYAAAGQHRAARRAQRHEPGHAASRRSSRRSSSTRWSSRCSCRSRCAACATARSGATALLRRNLLIYGLGGLIAPFVGHQADRPARPQPPRGVSVRVADRGRHKVFLGMAAGVGKTYRMLQEGQAEAEDGPRRRDRLPRAPRPRRDRRAGRGARGRARAAGSTYRDIDARGDGPAGVLARAPELCLIDELAHTNAPGRRARASASRTSRTCSPPGIDVFSTVNVQHLESLNDQVAELTGRARARDAARRGPRRGRRGRARRPHAGGAARAPAGGQGLSRASASRPR